MNYDIVILGAGCAGLTAAIYAARAGAKVLILEQEGVGGQIASAPRVENYPGFASISGSAFSDALFEQAMALGADLELEQVQAILPGQPNRVITDCGSYDAQAVIIATGAHHRMLGLAREAELLGHGISYCAVCDGAFFQGRSVAVVGGGSAALQSAEFLAGLCKEVHLIHRRDSFRGENVLLERIKQIKQIVIHPQRRVIELLGGEELQGLLLEASDASLQEKLPVEGLFICAGQEPNTEWIAELLPRDEQGYLIADEDCKTKYESIFVAGDCRTKTVRQLTTAAADGAVAALGAIKLLH